jgi:hypothetical protein
MDDWSCVEQGSWSLDDSRSRLSLTAQDGSVKVLAVNSLTADDSASATSSLHPSSSNLTPGGSSNLTPGGGAQLLPGGGAPLLVATGIILEGVPVSLISSCGSVALGSGSSPGEFCIAVRWRSAFGLGHVSCGFSDGAGGYMFGSVENLAGSPSVKSGGNNSGWYASGSKSDMTNAFTNNGTQCGAVQVPPYDALKCAPVANPQVDAAKNVMQNFPSRGYDVIGNNCLDACVQTYEQYAPDGDILDPFNYPIQPIPDIFFNSLPSSSWTCSPLAAQNCSVPP